MKDAAFQALDRLHERLNDALEKPQVMREKVRELEELAKRDQSYKYFCGTEHTFTKGVALPTIYNELITTFKLSAAESRSALLAEGFRNFPEIASNTPARIARHPFSKVLVNDAQDIYSQWSGRRGSVPLKQSCPDFSLRDPFPHNIVFEAKYFQGKSATTAERELVKTAYQAFFYLGLPDNFTIEGRPWGYDYAVAFIYDASPEGLFKSAWESLAREVKEGFWGGANVYIMVLRGEQT